MGYLLEKIITQNRLLQAIFLVAVVSALFLINGTSADALDICTIDSNCADWQYCIAPTCVDVLSCSGPRYADVVCSGDTEFECGPDKYCGTAMGTLITHHKCMSVTNYYTCLDCAYPTLDCNSNGGCEVNAATDPQNCGSCGNDCTTKAAYCGGDVKYQYSSSCSGGSCETQSLGCQNECCIQVGDVCNTDGVCAPPSEDCIDSDGDTYYSNAEACGAGAAKQDCNDADGSVQSLNSCGVCAAEPAGIGQSCTAGIGLCQNLSTYVCDVAGTGTACNAVAGTPTAEICGNGMDEDCNGADLRCPNCGNSVTDTILGEACDYTSPVTGTKTQTCTGGYPSVTLTCNEYCTGYDGGCGSCGDGTVNGPEQCEVGQSRTYTCPDGETTLSQACTAESCAWAAISPSDCVSCTNNLKDGTETGVDCGGSCSPCVSCTNGIKDGTETGIDCGGNCVAPSCSKTLGVCAGKTKTCGASGWVDCTAADYGPDYETAETKFDGLDNDCDGNVDESLTDCGNGVIDAGEQCDGSNLGGNTCASMGGVGSTGTASCNADCTINVDGCLPPSACYGVSSHSSKACCLSYYGGDFWGLSGEQNAVLATEDTADSALCLGFRNSEYPASFVRVDSSVVPDSYSSFLISGDKVYYAWTDGALNVLVASLDGKPLGKKQRLDITCKTRAPCIGTPKLAMKDGILYIAWSSWEQLHQLGGYYGLYAARFDTSKGANPLTLSLRERVPDAFIEGHTKIVCGNEECFEYFPAGYLSIDYTAYGDSAFATPIETSYTAGGSFVSSKIWVKPSASSSYQLLKTELWDTTTQVDYYLTLGPRLLRIGDYMYYLWVELQYNDNVLRMVKVGSDGKIVKQWFLQWPAIQQDMSGKIFGFQATTFGKKIYYSYNYWGQSNPQLLPSMQRSKVVVFNTETDSQEFYSYELGDVRRLLCTVKATSSVVDSQFKDSLGERRVDANSRLPTGMSSVGLSFCGSGNVFMRTRDCAQGTCTSSSTDTAVCDKPSDCVYDGRCYSDVTTVAATFFGGDTAQVLKSAWKGEVSADVNGDGKLELCDPGMWVGMGGTASGTVTVAGTGAPISYAVVSADSTNKAYAYSTTTAADGTYAFSSMEATNYDFTASKAGYVTGFYNNVPVQPSKNVQVDFQLDRATSTVSGYVTNLSPEPNNAVASAIVKVVGTAFGAVTDSAGRYTILDVPQDTYDLVATKVSDGYQNAVKLSVPLLESTASVNFTLLRSAGNCNNDCTVGSSNVCDASCNGKGSCWFASDAAMQACGGTFGLVMMPDGKYVECCMGNPYAPLKANMQVPSDNVIVTKIPVLFKGKFVNMVIAVFRKK